MGIATLDCALYGPQSHGENTSVGVFGGWGPESTSADDKKMANRTVRRVKEELSEDMVTREEPKQIKEWQAQYGQGCTIWRTLICVRHHWQRGARF